MISGETPHASLLNNATKVNSLRDVFDRFFKNDQARMPEANHAYFVRHISLINAFYSFLFLFFFSALWNAGGTVIWATHVKQSEAIQSNSCDSYL